jgi:hypothetical protein
MRTRTSVGWGNIIVDLSYNSRHDPDNVVAMEKIFIDTIKQDVDPQGNVLYEGYIKDDSKRYCRGVILRPDESLPYNSFKFALYDYGKQISKLISDLELRLTRGKG